MQFTDRQLEIISNALRIAMLHYAAETIAMVSEKETALAQQFRGRADEARGLYDLIATVTGTAC